MRRTDDTRKKHDGPEGLIPSLSTSSPNRLIRVMDPLDPARERVPDGRLSSFRPAEGGNRAVFSFIVLLIGDRRGRVRLRGSAGDESKQIQPWRSPLLDHWISLPLFLDSSTLF